MINHSSPPSSTSMYNIVNLSSNERGRHDQRDAKSSHNDKTMLLHTKRSIYATIDPSRTASMNASHIATTPTTGLSTSSTAYDYSSHRQAHADRSQRENPRTPEQTQPHIPNHEQSRPDSHDPVATFTDLHVRWLQEHHKNQNLHRKNCSRRWLSKNLS